MKNLKIFLLILLFLSICAPQKEYGTLIILWRVGGSTCYEAGIINVEVNLYRGDKLEANVKEKCGLGQVVIPDLPTGKYKVEIFGYNISNKKTHRGSIEGVFVSANKTTSTGETIVLSQIPASITLRWHFNNGRICSFNAVYYVEVTIWDSSQNKIFVKEYPCEPDPKEPSFQQGGMLIENLKADILTIELFGLGAPPEKKPLFRGTSKVKTVNAENTPVDVNLLECKKEIECI